MLKKKERCDDLRGSKGAPTLSAKGVESKEGSVRKGEVVWKR